MHFAARVFVDRSRQERSENHFTSSLRDELDRDIAQVTSQIDGRKRIMLAYIPPSVGALLLPWVALRMTGITGWAVVPIMVALLINLVFETRSQRRLVDEELVPRRRELESLRDKLCST